jgi:hypothetical protein
MKAALVIILIILIIPTSGAAQDGPIAAAVKQYGQEHTHRRHRDTEMRSPMLFWSGVVLASAGVVSSVAALTWAQQSDLSQENINTRLGRDLAPCGSDLNNTRRPVADCKVNAGLLALGVGMLAGGATLMIIGGHPVHVVDMGPRAFAARIRF